jgi:hypothetical protein
MKFVDRAFANCSIAPFDQLSGFLRGYNNSDVKITGRSWFGAAVGTTKTRCTVVTKRMSTESYRVAGRGQTNRQTNKQTDKQTNRQTRVSH